MIVATTLISAGVVAITSDILTGTVLLLLGAGVIIGRGFYKKYIG